MWIWFPENLVGIHARQYGFYASDIVYAALLVLLLLRVIEQPTRLRVALVGLTLGLAFWESVQIVPLAAPALAWTAWKRPGGRCGTRWARGHPAPPSSGRCRGWSSTSDTTGPR